MTQQRRRLEEEDMATGSPDEVFEDLFKSIKALSDIQRDIYHQVEEIRSEHNAHNSSLIQIQTDMKVQASIVNRVENIVSDIKIRCMNANHNNEGGGGSGENAARVIIQNQGGGEGGEKSKIFHMLLNPQVLLLLAIIMIAFVFMMTIGLSYVKLNLGEGKKEIIFETDKNNHKSSLNVPTKEDKKEDKKEQKNE